MADPAPRDRAELDSVPVSKEAGVTESFELYMRAEEIYVAAAVSLKNPLDYPHFQLHQLGMTGEEALMNMAGAQPVP